MKITVEIPESEVNEICRVTRESKKGPAILLLVTNALMLKRRENLANNLSTASGAWS